MIQGELRNSRGYRGDKMNLFKKKKNLNAFILAFKAKFGDIQITEIVEYNAKNLGEYFEFTLSALPDLTELTQFCSENKYELIRYRSKYKIIHIH